MQPQKKDQKDNDGIDQVFREQVRLIYSGVSYATLVTLTVGIILMHAHRHTASIQLLTGWSSYMLAGLALRILLVWRFHATRAIDGNRLAIWLRLYIAAIMLLGVGWGATGILFMPPESPPLQFLTAFVLAAVAVGSMTILAVVYFACAAFLVLALLPITLDAIVVGGEFGPLMAIMCGFLLAFGLLFSRRQHDVILRSLRLGFDNANLVNDLTTEKRRAERLNANLRHQEEVLARAQRIAGIGSWEWDILADEMRGSEEAYNIFGVDRDVPMITFNQFMELVHPEDRDNVTDAIRASIEQCEPYSIEHRIIRADGEEKVLLEQGELTFDERGDPVAMTGVTHDITDRYKMEEDLRNVSFAADAASRAKSQFLANMSHELRTPLNAIIGYSELLREEAEDRGETSEMADLDRIGAAGRHLLSLVNEVLDLSKVEAGKTELTIQEFDVKSLIDEIVDTVTPMAARNDNNLSVNVGDEIGMMRSDPTKLRQVLLNLLSNAAKFTEAGDIRLSAVRQGSNLGPDNPGNMVFTVSDTGHGIAPDQIDAAFTAFEQTDSSRNGTQGGTGLGLPLSRHFCAMMGGTIALESELGKGSIFTVRLPAEIGGEALPGLA
ncbi:MAG: ATP-binding protein [Alphaproteobacteria bacterium]|nr:ATP-binding protein [Alphaproteobacteria bacterium]